MVVGKGFSDAEMDALRRIEGVEKVVWLLPDDAKFSAGMKAKALLTAGTMLPAVIADRVKMCLEEHGLVPGTEEVKGGEVWGF